MSRRRIPPLVIVCLVFALTAVPVDLTPTRAQAPLAVDPPQPAAQEQSYGQLPRLFEVDAPASRLPYAGMFDMPRLPSAAAGAAQPPLAPEYAGWSQLVFQSGRNGHDWEVFSSAGDGSGQANLSNNSAMDIHPRLNRGATRVAFATNRDGNYEIYVMNADGSGQSKITFSGKDDVYPAWSPDGSRIAFQTYRDGQAEVYLMNPDGNGLVRLTQHSDLDVEPAWSPDGTQIAFARRSAGQYRIWVMNADGSNPHQLSNQAYSENPAWSPDGSQIAYDADGDGDGWQELWLMDAAGGNQRQVYDPGDQTDAWARSWSPDSRYVAFTRVAYVQQSGNWYWTTAYLDAWDSRNPANTMRLSSNGEDWNPDWQTMDMQAPTSNVLALPAQSPAPFTISWSGTDSGPSGIANYDIQVKDGAGGAWTDWLVATAGLSASYAGMGGHTSYFLDAAGAPAAGVAVRLYQAGPGRALYPTITDGVPEITGTTDGDGLLVLANRPVGDPVTTRTRHTLRDNPFSIVDIIGERDDFIVELSRGAHQEYAWLEITRLNLARWRGEAAAATIELRSHVPAADAPPPPGGLSGEVEHGQVSLRWPAAPGPVGGYNLYRTRFRPDFEYERVATGLSATQHTAPYDYSQRAVTYAVTAVDAQGRESGFSRFFNAFSLVNPAAIAVAQDGSRVVLDPQNGYAVLAQAADGRWLDTLGSVHHHLELSWYMARDGNGRLIFSHPGDWYSNRHSVKVADAANDPLFEFGDTGLGPGQFVNPSGVAVWGAACSVEGPYQADASAWLLLHFDGSYDGAGGETGTASGMSFAAGRYGQALSAGEGATLSYETAGNLNREQGAIEFWVRPDWDGNDERDYNFFEVGNEWSNRIRITKDGANNLRLMVWDDQREYGVATNVGGWRAGEWHHVAATWAPTGLALYTDGELRDRATGTRPPQSLAPRMFIGSDAGGGNPAQAAIDEFRISAAPRVGNSDTCTRILVADSSDRIQAFDALGGFLGAYGSTGDGPGQFHSPQGLAVDDRGRVIVADVGNNRLQLLSFDGSSFGYLRSIEGFTWPTGVWAYGADGILVADTGANAIVALAPDGGAYTRQVYAPYNAPHGVAADASGSLIVADTGNRRVVTVPGALPTFTPTPQVTATPTPTITTSPTPTPGGAIIAVNTAADELNADGDCSLREAIQAANTDRAVDGCPAGSGPDTIKLPAGDYALALAGAGEDANAAGDLDITGDLDLLGADMRETRLDGKQLDRVLHVLRGATVRISGVMITGGRTPDGTDSTSGGGAAGPGGGIANYGELTLTACGINGNATGNGGDLIALSWFGQPRGGHGGNGGGIFNAGGLHLFDSWVVGNATGSGGIGGDAGGIGEAGAGGGIYIQGKLALDRVTVSGNRAGTGGYLVSPPGTQGGPGGNGAGIFNAGEAVISQSAIENNRPAPATSPGRTAWPARAARAAASTPAGSCACAAAPSAAMRAGTAGMLRCAAQAALAAASRSPRTVG